jgi:diaminopimelate epimerase
MRYWNADGGEAEMCGNGLRCVARYAVARGWVAGESFVVETAMGPRPVHLTHDGAVRALLGTPSLGSRVEIGELSLHVVDLGNPHAITWVEDPEAAPVEEVGSEIETAPQFPSGTNVEFATVTAADQIQVRVWERGIGETLACGTGAAATAYVAFVQGLVGSTVSIRLRGGILRVDLADQGAWIEGPANTVFAGELS